MDIFNPFSAIADAFNWGKQTPKPKDVAMRQTEKPLVEWLYREQAQHPSRGLTPPALAAIFQEAEQGNIRAQAQLFMDMREKDAHIDAEMTKRIMAVKKLDWRLEPPRNASATEKKRTALMEELLRDQIDVAELKMNLLDAIGHAYSCIELGWGQTPEGYWYPNLMEHREPDWFVCPLYNRNTLHLRNAESFYGEPLQPFGWIPHIQKSRSGYLPRAGLHRALAWPYLYKNFSVRDLAEFLEIYGLPIRIGKYNPNATDQEKRDLLRTVLSIGHNAAGIIPDTMQIELQSVVANGSGEQFKTMIDWCEEKQSMAILGGTLTSKTGANGNRSLGDVHNEVRMDIRDDDAGQIDYSLSKYLIYPIAMLNAWFEENRCPSFISDTQDPEDLTQFGEAIPKLVQAGAKIPTRYINEKLKIPVPAEGEEILTVLSRTETITTDNADVPNTQQATKAAAKLTALLLDERALTNNPRPHQGNVSKDGLVSGTAAAYHTEELAGKDATTKPLATAQSPEQLDDTDPTPVTAQTDLLAAAAAPSIKQMVDQVRKIVDQAQTLEQLRDNLLNGYAHLDNAELVKVMQLAFAAADLAGRFDVKEGG